MESQDQIKVLLIEDDPDDAFLLDEMLGEITTIDFDLTHVERLEPALQHLREEDYDVILVDLSLPDSKGIETVDRVNRNAKDKPVVVLTGLEDEAMAIMAVQHGAQDYLNKGRITGELLVRALRYAIERSRLEKELEKSRQREERRRELHSLEQLSATPPTAITGLTFGIHPLRESAPSIFAEFVEQYSEFLDLALEQRGYRIEHDLTSKVRSLAEQTGKLKAGPRDVIEIHSTALNTRSASAPHQKAQAYIEEGRLLLLRFMGHLVSFYRNYYLGGHV